LLEAGASTPAAPIPSQVASSCQVSYIYSSMALDVSH
jgi:hypothetical protein